MKRILLLLVLVFGFGNVFGQVNENFNTIVGTGGNSGGWSGSIASNSQANFSGWTFANAYRGDACLKLGTGSNKGTAQTPAIGIAGNVTLTFRAGAWDGNSEQTELILTIAGGGTLASNSVVMVKGSFSSYSVAINGSTVNTKVTFAGKNNSNSRFFLDDVVVVSASNAPEINLQGNGNDIVSGATSTSLANNTNFGDQNISSGSVVKTFTIQNTGSAALNLTGTPHVVIGGANAADFTVTQVPSTPIAATSGSTTFQITFDPSTVGVKNATVSIANNDSDENPYTFVIQGNGIFPTPIMVVKGSGVTIVSGDSTPSVADGTNFGSTAINTTITKTFTIENTGTANLILPTNPILLMDGTAGFTFTNPTSSNVAPNGSTTFTVSFNSATAGLKEDHIMIASNDNNASSTYEFAINATATDFPANPSGTISGTTPACTNTTLTYTGTIPSDETYYWQTSVTGTSTANNAASNLVATIGGTYFVRAFRGGSWSAGASTGYAVVINTTPAISAHPSTATVGICPGATSAALSVTASGTSLTYQWYKSTDNSNATPGDDVTVGTSSASFTPSNSEIGTFYYYVVVSGASPCPPVTSNVSGARTVNAIPATPQGTITPTSSCGPTNLTYNFAPGESTDGNTYYWQTVSTAVDTGNPVLSTTQTQNINGTRFVRSRNASGCWSDAISQAITISTAPSVTTQPNSASVQIPTAKTFTIVASGSTPLTYQWQLSTDGGTNWNNIASATSASYSTGVTSESMNGYRYQCIVTNSCGSATSNVGTLNLTNATPNNGLNLDNKVCYGNSTVDLSWNASTSTGSDIGYIVFVNTGSIPRVTNANIAGNAIDYNANSDYSLANSHIAELGKTVYKGTGTSVTVTGLTPGVAYYYKVVAYRGNAVTGWSNSITNNTANSSFIVANAIARVPEITNLTATIAPTSSSVSWNVVPNSSGCYEYMVVANQGAVTLIPSGDGSSYTASTIYAGGNQVIYKGTGNSVGVTGLTESNSYCYKVFVRKGNEWSEGTSFCRTTGVNYCESYGDATDGYETGIRRVVFNTIDNPSPAEDNDYSDFTATSTTVNLGETYDLSVYINTDGDFTSTTKAWIDWNRDGDFLDSNESYELGTATNVSDGITSLSPLSITVPTGASLGNVRMRISTKYGTDPSTSCEKDFDGEVEDYTLRITQATGAEIYVKGNNQNIASGSTVAAPLNLTLFAGQTIGSSQEKTYEIGNVGLSNLLLTGTPIVKIEGANPGDFSVTQYPASSISTGNISNFKITFTPTSSGVRTAVVSIANNDLTGNENPFTFLIQGIGLCNSITTTVTPASGPVGTEVTITATSGTITGGTVTFNGIPAISVTHVSSTVIKAIVPAGATTGNVVVTNDLGCPSSIAFQVIDVVNAACETTPLILADLIIYEVMDENGGSGGYVSIYNSTGASKDLSNYAIFRNNNYNASSTGYSNYSSLSGTLAHGELAVVKVSATNRCTLSATGNGTISAGFNENDGLQLRNGGTVVDDFAAPNRVGYYLKRKLSALVGRTLFDSNDWETTNAGTNDCFGDGLAPVMIGETPTITLQPIFTDKCGTTSLTIEATEGFDGGHALSYQWFFTAPGSANWSEIIDGGVYNGATTANLSVSSLAGLEGYQFYAQVRENTNVCFAATNAVGVVASSGTVTWDGITWVGGLPDKTKDVIITGIYSTVAGNFEARSLVNNGEITITDGGHIKIEYGLTNNGPFNIENNGSLVQVCDDAVNTGTEIQVERITKPMYRYDFTYWSSPVSPQTVGALSPTTLADKYFKWDTNYQDWANVLRSQEMDQGLGYIIRAPQTFSTNPLSRNLFTGNFEGTPNNGVVTVAVEGSTTAQKWNLLGNPYPSAISADKFLDSNLNNDLEGTIYVWTHNTPLDPEPNENGFYSYAPNDYAVYNALGGTATAPGAAVYEGYIASGQGFFVKGTANGTATFNNEMRLANRNAQFLRTPEASRNITERSRIWLDISNAQSAYKQILIGYVDGATNEIDREFDGEILGSNALMFYSVISQKTLAIQGRALPFDTNDKVDLGYKTIAAGNLTVSLSNLDGLFTDQNVYLEDKVLNVIHDLKQSDYTFASAIGTFNDRFVLRYTNETLGNPDFGLSNNSVNIGVKDKTVTIKSSIENIQKVSVYDLLGRVIYDSKNVGSREFIIDELTASNQALVVKIYLENGTATSKKIVVN